MLDVRSVRSRSCQVLWLTGLIAVMLLVFATTAVAGTITNWRSYGPTGIVGTNMPVIVNATGPISPDPLVPTSLKLFIDGVLVPRSSYTSSVLDRSVYVYYIPSPALTDGAHTFRVEVSDAAGRLSTKQWSATIAQPPSASWVSPATGSVFYNGRPAIIMSLSDNTPGTTYTITGQVRAGSASGPVAATFGMSTASPSAAFTLGSELAPGTYYLTATVSDSAGHLTTLQGATARSFTSVSADAMSIFDECDSCHASERTAHPTPDYGNAGCIKCHVGYNGPHMGPELYCDSCHEEWHTNGAKTTVAITASCTSCHSPSRPDLPRHTVENVGPQHASRCGNCHKQSLIARHATTPAGSAYPNQCAMCHSSTSGRVNNAIAAGDEACSACHDADPGHGFDPALHEATGTSCVAAGCHATTALVDAHASYVGAGNRYPQYEDTCALCHYNTNTDRVPDDATAECSTCHPDRLAPHGYDPAKHMSTETCLSNCHDAELKPVHDAATPPVACSGCHPTRVDEVEPWDKSCGSCHPTLASDHAPEKHVGTDVAYQEASFFGSGCSNTAGHTGQLACHDIGSLARLHSTMPDRGCSVCHGDGNTPKQECFDCHKPGYATTYTVPGPATPDIVATGTPTSDISIAPTWTSTTVPAGQPVYAVVNSPYPPVDTTRYVTITSTSAGRMLFGWNRSLIPDNAVIRDVRIYAKAKAANSTYPRRMRGVFKIGGQEYLSANQSANLTTAWSSGAGTNFYTSPTRVDYNREPLYGESIWRNPATGQDWTPAELNGTDPDSSLEAFGIDLTSSTAANNVSFAQIYMKVTYYTVGASVTNPTVGTHIYHGNNVKYLHDPSDVPAGQRFATSPAHGWYDALYYQDCYDFCHRGNGGAPTFSAEQGTWMWYSVGGDPTDSVAATRTLTLRPVVIPAASASLNFRTNYQLGTGAAGYVEISTNDGGSWTPLSGTVGGVSVSSLTGNASGWVSASYDLSSYAGQSAQLRFRYVNGQSGSAGWAFDSLVLGSSGDPTFADDAETLKPEWTNRYWTRSMGAFPYQ